MEVGYFIETDGIPQRYRNDAVIICAGGLLPTPLLQKIGWVTPNTWALEAYAGVFWRGQGPAHLVLPVGLLLVSGVAGTLVALRLARRQEAL